MGKCMTANELADLKEFEKMLSVGYLPAVKQAIEMLCQQQAEIEFLKKEILAKHEDWKHEGQQAANAKAEIEALKEPKIPLLEQEIKFILGNGQCWQGEDCSMPNLMYIIRAVEAAVSYTHLTLPTIYSV